MRLSKDNTTLTQKTALRLNLLAKLDAEPVILETHAGEGRIYFRCYRQYERGVAIEKKAEKVEKLAAQRPTWAVYEGDSEKALAAGCGSHEPINLIDVDPYGDSWPTISAYFSSNRPRPDTIALAVNDGIRQMLCANLGWKYPTLAPAVARFGNHRLHAEYLDVCYFMLRLLAEPHGYRIEHWQAYYVGHGQQLTHFGAILKR